MTAFVYPERGKVLRYRIPGTKKTLNEQQSAQVVQAILPALSSNAANQVRRVMAGEADTLTFVAHVEVAG